ncbi:MAG: TetR/AcrR family transcriptional regulator [Micrococcales bacterium]|nr:TetR/AcrR family transcriptional regulator [Micrococcales bacterium]MCL2668266.1 TetR/AcrR family transcriptional regulator [Micrococcales bacterium]
MPKIIAATLREHREQVRRRLFKALSELIVEQGFDQVTLSQVAARAGVGRTALYNHFPDKEALLVGLIMYETAAWAKALEAALVGIDDPVEQLRTYIHAQLVLKPNFHFGPAPDLRRVLSTHTLTQVRNHVALAERILSGVLERGMASGAFPVQDVDVTARLVLSCLSSRALSNSGDRARSVAQVEEFVLRALGANMPVHAAA